MCFLKKHKEFSGFARVSCELRMDVWEERKKNANTNLILSDCEQFLFCSTILGKNAKKNATHIRAVSRKSASVICEATAHK